jgi:hypothetical protein
MFQEAYSILAVALALVMCVVVVYFLVVGDGDDRANDEAARDYFDAHGYWPDEKPTA